MTDIISLQQAHPHTPPQTTLADDTATWGLGQSDHPGQQWRHNEHCRHHAARLPQGFVQGAPLIYASERALAELMEVRIEVKRVDQAGPIPTGPVRRL